MIDLGPLSRSRGSKEYKTYKKLLLSNCKAQGTHIWPVACWEEGLPSLLNSMTLTLFQGHGSNVYKTFKKLLRTNQKAQGTDIWPEACLDEGLPNLLK